MKILIIEPTNRCNRACLHCLRNRTDPRQDLPLEIAEHILEQARELGIRLVCLTGGEVALYPHLENLLRRIAALGFDFYLVSNGYQFWEYVLPPLREPEVRARLHLVSLSLDGTTPRTHDALRGPGSFAEVGQALACCKKYHIPFNLKTAITALNQTELAQLALFGAQ